MTEPSADSFLKNNSASVSVSPAGRHKAMTKAGGSYTRFANSMRIILPLVAMAIVVLVIAWPQLTERPKRFSLNVSDIAMTESGAQQIVNARFTGTDSKNRPYTVTADTASQAKNAPDMIDLAFPKADITLQNGAWLALSAESGTFNRKIQVLNLMGGVNIFHDVGYQLSTAAANIFMKDGSAAGDKPVSGQGPIGTVEASGFRILDGGKRVIFTGKSRLVLYPAGKGPKG